MWNPKSDILRPRSLIRALFVSKQRDQCIWHHRFASFIVGFPDQVFTYSAPMPKIDVINCKTEGSTVTYSFVAAMTSESNIASNINVFEELIVNQLGLSKEDPRFGKLLTIW